MPINKKRVQRLWREEGLRNPLQKRRKRARGHSENSCAMKKAEYRNHVWCWDFTMDETADGRRLKWFSVLDEFTRECLALEVERRMTARDVVAILTWLEAEHGAPGAVRSDNVLTQERRVEVRAKIPRASVFQARLKSKSKWLPQTTGMALHHSDTRSAVKSSLLCT